MPDPDPRPHDETAFPEVRDDRLCDRFEFLLKAGRVVEVDAFLRAEGLDPAAHPDLVTHLARVEAHYHADGETRGFAAAPAGGPADLQPGMVFDGKYTLLKNIGGGGMGEVWAAQQERPVKRLVAVKVIKTGMDTRAVLARFEAERQALAVMDHANIARVYDAGTTPAGRPYFVMELVKGVSITKFCDTHTLTPAQRMRLFLSVCEAIQHAHLKGIIHRDIKPSNVMVTTTDDPPVVKVIDFGIAKAVGDRLTEHTFTTGFGAVIGTPEYMSPEQAGLNAQDIDMRSDVYSLGVLLYELLTGTTPVDRKSLKRAALAEVLRMVREVDAPRPSDRLSSSADLPSLAATRGAEPKKLTGQLRGEVDWILLRALEKDRRRRYESPNALAEDVRRHLNNEVVGARPPTPGYKLRKFVRRNKGPVLAAAAVFVALLGGVIGTTLGLIEAKRGRDDADTQKGIAEANEQSAKANEKRAQDAEGVAQREKRNALAVAASSALDQAQQVCEGGNVVRGLHLMLKALTPAIESGDASIEDAVRSNITAWLPHANRILAMTPGSLNCGAMEPNGKRLVMGSHKGELSIREAVNCAQIGRVENVGAVILQVAWQPGGDTIAVLGRDGLLRLWTAGTPIGRAKYVRVCGQMNDVPRGALSFTPDGTKLLVGAMGRSAVLVDMAKAEVVAPAFFHGSTHCDAVAISPDGTKAVIATPNWSARVHDLATGQPLTPVIRTYGCNFCTGISPDGTKFFTGHHMDASLQVWDMSTGAAVGPRIAPGGPVLTAAFSPDGRHLAIGGWMAYVREWDWKAGTPVGSPIPCQGYSVAYSSDGKRLMTAADGLVMWQLPDRDLLWMSERLPGSVHGFAIRPDSEELALTMSNAFTRDSDGSQTAFIRRYNAATGEPIRPFLPTPYGRFAGSIRYTPDGKTIFCAQDTCVTEYDLTKAREVRRLTHPDSKQGYGQVDLTSDGRYLTIGGGGKLAVHDLTLQAWTHRINYDKYGGTLFGFLPGTHTLLDFSHSKLLAIDVNSEKVEPVTRYATRIGYYCQWCVRPDGQVLAVLDSAGNLIEHDLSTNQPTGLTYGNLMGSPPLYSPDGRWLYVGDQSGYAARHRATRKRLGPYYTDVDGLGWGVTPDGKHLITTDADRRLNCWRVPMPITGTPEEVTRAVVERIGVEQKEGGFLTIRPPARSTVAPNSIPPLPVFDSRELHNADLDELKKWLAALPKTHRPIHITAQEGSNGKRFDALAIDDGTGTGFEAHLALGPKEREKWGQDADDPAMWAKGWHRSWCNFYYADGTLYRHHLWTKGTPYHSVWPKGDKLADGLAELRSKKMRPIGVISYDGNLFLHGGPDDGLKWELHHDLTAAQVKDKIEDARKRKWRPTLVHRHREKADQFVLVLADNPHDTGWEYYAPLSLKEYEAKLADAKGRGLRPEYVHSWVANKEPVYSVVLVGDYRPPPKEVLPAPRPD